MENNFEQLRMLNLTDDDFKLLVDGLDALPEKGFAGEILGSLFEGMLSKDNPEAQEKLKLEREKKAKKMEREKQEMKDNVRILQGKLLMLKRYFQQNGILKEAYEILNIPSNSDSQNP